MLKEDHSAFGKMMLTVGELYGKDVTPTMITLYFRALEEFALKEVGRAFNLHVKNPDNGQFFPKPADLIRLLNGNTESQGLLAWSKVMDGIRRVGAWRSVSFDDPIIHLVIVDMGGWPKLCDTKEDDAPFVGREFEKRYRAYSQQGVPEKFPRALLGLADKANAGSYAPETPMLIGDAQAAKKVLLLGGDEQGSATPIGLASASAVLKSLPGRAENARLGH